MKMSPQGGARRRTLKEEPVVDARKRAHEDEPADGERRRTLDDGEKSRWIDKLRIAK